MMKRKPLLKKDAFAHLAAVTKTTVCVKIKKLIASLQQEQPEVDIDIKQELYHHFGQVKDFTLGVAIASYFHELGLNARKEEQI